jgi:TetR/AcrR family transcriptional regulator, cholesterol catabolism regulator
VAVTTREEAGRRARRKRQTRDRILDTAVRLFATRGYEETSVDEIAEAADVARQTFFNHFHAKEDVIHAWVEQRRREVRAGLETPGDADSAGHGAAGADAPARLTRGLLTVAALYDADADVSRPMVRYWVHRGGPLGPDAGATADLLRSVVESGQAAGELRADLDARSAAQVLLDVYLGCLYRWAADGGDLRDQLRPAVALVLDAMRPRP